MRIVFLRKTTTVRVKDHRGVDLISDALPFGGIWYGEPNAVSNAVGYAKFYSRSHDAVIRVYDEAGNVIETHEHAGEFIRHMASEILSGIDCAGWRARILFL